MEKVINTIKINNYKCFEKFDIQNLKQINIITGLNNIGKTALLEAIYLNINSNNSLHLLSCISDIFHERGFYGKNYIKLESIFSNTNLISIESSFNFFTIEKILGSNLSIKDKELFISSNNMNKQDFFSLEKLAFFKFTDTNNKSEIGLLHRVEEMLNNLIEDKNYISSNNMYISSKVKNSTLLKYTYENITSIFKEDVLIKSLQLIDKDVEKLNIINDMLQVKLTRLENYIPINELGDGFCRVTEILMSLYISKTNIILIDEIESGIHYTKIKSFWTDILTICKYNNIQLFSTTHSKEFIDTLSQVCTKSDFTDISLINIYNDNTTTKYTMIDSNEILSNRIKLNLENR